jgi:2'-5' RNA ligase
VRLFVALDVPAQARAALADWAAAAAPVGVRPVREQNLHVTLAFLGTRSAQEGGVVAAMLPRVARRVGTLRTADAQWLPPRRPGVLTVALDAGPELDELHEDLLAALASEIDLKPEGRPLRPHVTVGRVPRGSRVRPRELGMPVPALAFAPEALTLYRSHAQPGGSRYEPLARVTVGP